MLASCLERFSGRLSEVEERIGYRFKDRTLLLEALLHRSFSVENGLSVDNERLEFLGDAFLNYAVGHYLYRRFPELTEGALSRERAQMVREEALAWAARRIGLGEYILLGKGEELQGGRDRSSNLADAFEALVGAILVDGGVKRARAFVKRALIDTPLPEFEDYKSRLIELCRNRGFPVPSFKASSNGGRVRVEVSLEGFRAVVFAYSKREGERLAAKIIYRRLQESAA